MYKKVSNGNELVQGIFKHELKNRFLCVASVNGVDTVCYIPSSSRLENFIELKGKQVLLRPVTAKDARTSYAVYAVKKKQNYILLNTSIANTIVFDNIGSRRFSMLGKRRNVLREKRLEEYKCDLFIEDTNTLVEIKSIITNNQTAIFPTVHSDRANCQLKSILELLNKGTNALYCFVSLNPYVKTISINQNDEEYYHLFSECLSKGMMVMGLSVELKHNEPQIKNVINVSYRA